jgi:hypothetical protein
VRKRLKTIKYCQTLYKRLKDYKVKSMQALLEEKEKPFLWIRYKLSLLTVVG